MAPKPTLTFTQPATTAKKQPNGKHTCNNETPVSTNIVITIGDPNGIDSFNYLDTVS
jgi:hypothetical protein